MNIFPSAVASLGTGYGGVQMSMIGFRAASTPATAKSGWYRLQLYQLQEESLAKDKEKDEQKQRQEAPSRKSEGTAAKPVAAPHTWQRKPRRRSTTGSIVHEPIVKPFVFRRVTQEETVIEKLSGIIPLPDTSFNVKIATAKIIQISQERNKRLRSRRRAVAFLLLAA